MKNISKTFRNFLSSITLVVFTTILVLFFLYSILYPSSQNIFLDQQKTNLSEEISKHPQYKEILNLQSAFIRNAKTIGPSVVNLSKVQEEVNPISSKYNIFDKNSWFYILKNWFSDHFSQKKYISETIGSGVIINTNGFILTNYHVIEGHRKILVRLSNKRSFFAEVIGVDPETDLAVIKVDTFRRLPLPLFGPTTKIMVGQWVMAIGNPYGLEGSVTVGVISGIQRSNLGIAKYENFLQTDASINPGNSGGPLINLQGEIVGINTSFAPIAYGVGFAIPISIALRISEELIKNGNVERGWLGISIQEMTPALLSAFKINNLNKGILVNEIENNAPAKKAGIMRGDIVLKYDGKNVINVKKFQLMVANTQAGTQVSIDIIRDSLEKTLVVTIGKLIS